MSSNFLDRRTRFTTEVVIRHFSGAVLCALLLFFCTNSRLARYEFRPSFVRTASTQCYVDGQDTLKKLPPTKPLLPFGTVISALLSPRIPARTLPMALSSPLPFEGFSPGFSPRPPPTR